MTTRRLERRKILITGAASGIGYATAKLLAAEGAALAMLDITAVPPELLNGPHASLAVDLADGDATQRAVREAAAFLGGLDGIINCAGVANMQRVDEVDLSVWTRVLTVNLTAPFLICQAALPWLRQATGATIVNVASGQALLPNAPGSTCYGASKGGLVTFSKALAAELAPAIRVNVICPGIVDTAMVSAILGDEGNPNDAPFVRQYALQRVAEPAEIAASILFLSSSESSYITGAALAVDGGRTFH